MLILAAAGLFVTASASAGSSPDCPTVVPFEVHPQRGAVLVTVTVNGHAGTWFVDTGAAVTVVDAKAAGPDAEHALKRARFEASGAGLTGQGVVVAVDLELGGRTWKGRHVAAMDLSDIARVYGRQVDGIIGTDLLREYGAMTIDWAARRLTLSPAPSR